MPKRVAITAFFTLPMIRRHLEEFGHGFKLSEIKVALDIPQERLFGPSVSASFCDE